VPEEGLNPFEFASRRMAEPGTRQAKIVCSSHKLRGCFGDWLM